MVNKKDQKVSKTPNYVKYFLILASAVSGCILISAFASLLANPIEVTISVIGLKNCAKTARNKNYNSIIKKENEKFDNIVLLAKS